MKRIDELRADREIARMVPGGPRKCEPRPSHSTERAEDGRVSKDELEDLLRDAGLGGQGKGRETARVLCCDEKTLRRWRDPRCMADMAPPDIRIILIGRALEAFRFSRTG